MFKMKTNQYLIDFYNSNDENSRLGSKHGAVEFLTTMHYIEKYLKPGDRILEIGAGTGRYSHALARQGYAVNAVELVEYNIDIFRKNTLADEKISVIQGNALDLSAFPDNQFDITLLLGPLYHLYNKKDKQQAIREAIRVTKHGGIIFAAYVISDGSLLDEGFNQNNFNVAEYIKNGLLDPETFAAKSEPKICQESQTMRLIYLKNSIYKTHSWILKNFRIFMNLIFPVQIRIIFGKYNKILDKTTVLL